MDAVAQETRRDSGKYMCIVDCAEVPEEDGLGRLANLLTAVLLSEDGAFHGQVLRL